MGGEERMKRSEINSIIKAAEQFLGDQRFYLPVWGQWGVSEWQEHRDIVDEIAACGLGWDITDFGSGTFESRGLVLFTLRNGRPGGAVKPYAEKIMVVNENQETPLHFHFDKQEDIINRGGGVLLFELFNSTASEELADTPVEVKVDAITRSLKAGETLALQPGESLTLPPGLYHRFYAAEGSGRVLTGEVSAVNDDHSDNRFHETLGRFPEIIEDEEPYRLLVSDYETFLGVTP